MTAKEAKALGIDPEKGRQGYIRIEASKVNIWPPTADTVWFELVGVALGNTTETYPNGDNVQTVRRWKAPIKMIGGVVEAIGRRILDVIDAGLANGDRYSAAPNAHGESAATNAVLSVIPNYTRPAAREVIGELRKERWLYDAEYRTKDRKARHGLYVRGGKVKPEGGDPDEPDQGEMFPRESPF
jgi:hypothetical protein